MNATDRTAWLTERRTGLGATDMAAIAGVGFRNADQVYAEKTADVPPEDKPLPIMQMGLATEDHNARMYTERTGEELLAPGLLRMERKPWVFATFDRVHLRLLGEEPESKSVELKYTAFFDDDEWGDDGTDHIPDDYLIQATWQSMILVGRGHKVHGAAVSALNAFGEHRVYSVPYNGSLAAMLFDLGAEFWERVQNRSGLDGWESPIRDEIGAKLAAIRPDTAIELDASAADIVWRYEAAKAEEKSAKERAAANKERLVEMLDGAECGRLPDGRRITQKVQHRKGYTVEPCQFTDFRITKAAKSRKPNEVK